MARSSRTRLSREDIRKKAAIPTSGGNWFKLPDGVSVWEPKTKGKYLIDIVPYETKSKNHPNDVAPGVVWYQYPFKVHHGVGAEGKSLVCPTSIGMKCPICEEQARLSKNYDENKEIIDKLRAQKYTAFNILDPDDLDKIAIFALSVGKFYNLLEKELEEADDEDLANFFDVTKQGKTLKVRFSDASYAGRKYLEATKIEFVDRDPMDEDEIFGKVVCLDTMFVVLPYEKLKAMFLEVDEEDDDPPPKRRSSRDEEDDDPPPKRKRPPIDEEDDDPPPKRRSSRDEEEDDDPPPPKKKASRENDIDDSEWDDDPPPKRRSSRDEEDDDDPPPPKKRTRDLDDDDPPKRKPLQRRK